MPALAGMGRMGWDQMKEGGRDPPIGAVEVDVGLLLELASRAGIGLGDVVAMTSAQLTPGFLHTGILSTAGSASRVAVPDAPPATATSGQAPDRDVPPMWRQAGVRKGRGGMQYGRRRWRRPMGRQGPRVPSGAELVEPGEIKDAGKEGAVVVSGAEHADGVAHGAELKALGSRAAPPASRVEDPGSSTRPTKRGPVDTPGTGPAEGRAGVSWAAVAAGRRAGGTRPEEEAQLRAVAWAQSGA